MMRRLIVLCAAVVLAGMVGTAGAAGLSPCCQGGFAQDGITPEPPCSMTPSVGPNGLFGCGEVVAPNGQVVACFGGSLLDNRPGDASATGPLSTPEPLGGCFCIGSTCFGSDHNGNNTTISAQQCSNRASEECAENGELTK